MRVLSQLTLPLLISCCLMMGFSFHTQAQMIGGTVGSTAPNIELPDQYGNKVSLSGLRGNLVLVRFWKSGDPNSRATNMNIDALHKKYKGASFQTAKGFEVFMVSLDSRLDKWKMALQQDQLPANYHVNDIYSKYVGPYGVGALPVNFLLDENGVIIANTKSMAELDKELSSRARVYGAATTTTTIPLTNTNTTASGNLLNTSDRPAPATFNQTTPVSESLLSDAVYVIQLGAYKNWDKDRFLDAAEYGMITAEDAGNGIKRALLGKFTTPEDVVSTLSKLQAKGYMDAFPVEYKNNARRIIGRKEVATLATKAGVTVVEPPVRIPSTVSKPTTMSIATTTTTTPAKSATTSSTSGHYEYPFSNNNTNNNPITSIPDEVISTTYHNGGSSVVTTTTETSTTGNVATYHSGGGTVTNNSTLVPSEIPVFTGGVNPANNNSGTYYDSDAYELSWYPSEPSTAQPNIIESPYYNSLPATKDPNTMNVPNYENNGNGWQQQGWTTPNNGTTNNNSGWTTPNNGTTNNNSGWTTPNNGTTNNNSGWTTPNNGTTNNNSGWTTPNNGTTNNNSGWSDWKPVEGNNMNNTNSTDPNFYNNGTQQPNMNGQWDNNGQNTQPNNGELDKSLDSYLDGYDFSSVDDNSEKPTTSSKKKKKKRKKKKKKR